MSVPSSGDEPPVTSAPGEPPSGHYFSASPDSESRRGRVRLDLPDRSVELVTDRGVFSHERIDPGTKILLMELPELTDGPVLDLGCGYGPIAATVALRHPELDVIALDVNERARELTAENARRLGVGVRVVDPELAEQLGPIGTIVSNPPIRIGKAALHELLSRWLGRLAPGASAYLVVHQHLGADSLARWLTAQGATVQRLRSRQGYRVLRVTPDH